MTKSNSIQHDFATVQNRYVSSDFDGGDITSDGGLLLLHKLDRKLGFTKKSSFRSYRQSSKREDHTLSGFHDETADFALASGYSDLNDH